MGAEPWKVFTPYRESAEQALLEVQHREFEAGNFDPHGILAADGITPESIDELREIMEDSGTATVLDMLHTAESPQWFAAARMSPERLSEIYGTDKPTRSMVEGNQDFFSDIDRGQGVYFVVYNNDQPDEYVFAGYSFD